MVRLNKSIVQRLLCLPSPFNGKSFPVVFFSALIIFTFLCSPKNAFAITCTSANTGNWNTASTWAGCWGGFPGTNDTAIISTHSVTLTVSTTVASVILSTPTRANVSLTQLDSASMTVTGGVTIYASSSAIKCGWNINQSTAIVGGTILFNSTRTAVIGVSSITITSGQLDANGGFTFIRSTAPARVIVMNNRSGVIRMKGAITAPVDSSSFSATAGSFNYYDTNAQTVSSFSAGGYYNLYLNNTNVNGATLGFNITSLLVQSTVSVQSGTFKNGGFAITGASAQTFSVLDGATFEMSGTSAYPASFGTYNFGNTSTVRYLQTTSPLTISTPTSYGNLELMPAGNAVMVFATGTVSVQGNLTIGDGVNFATVTANSGIKPRTLVVVGTVTINSSANFYPSTTTTLYVGGGFSNSGTFTPQFSTITFNGAGVNQILDSGSSTLYSVVHSSAGNLFLNNNNLLLTGNLVNNAGWFEANNEQIVFAGTAGQRFLSISGADFSDVISSNTSAAGLTFSSSFTANNFTVNTSPLISAVTIYFAGNSTYTISTLSLLGTSSKHIILKSSDSTTSWNLNNTSTNTINYVEVQRSSASAGVIIDAKAGGFNLGNNINWLFDLIAPSATTDLLATTGSGYTTLNLSWSASGNDGMADPFSGTYRIYLSSVSSMIAGVTVSSNSSTALTRVDISTIDITPGEIQYAAFSGLKQNTTYYARIYSADATMNWSSISNGTTAQTWGFYVSTQPGGFSGVGNAHGVSIGDFDLDGDLDISVNGHNGATYVWRIYLNDGTGSFPNMLQPNGTLGPGNGGSSWGDYDNDNDLDIAVAGHNGTAYDSRVYPSSGNGTGFGAYKSPFGVPGHSSGILWGDFNNDGFLDLVGAGWDGTARTFEVVRNKGDSTFGTISSPSGAAGPDGVPTWGDFNNDGFLDVAGIGFDGTNTTAELYRGRGDGTWATALTPTSNNGLSGGGAFADFNNDGWLDLGITGHNNSTQHEVEIYPNNGLGTGFGTVLQVDAAVATNGSYGTLSWGDIDNDGLIDLGMTGSVGTNEHRSGLYRNLGNSSFTARIDVWGFTPNAGNGDLQFADLDNDGDLDFAVNGSSVGAYIFAVFKSNRVELLGPSAVNTTPSAPSGMTYSWAYNVSKSTLTFKWDGGSYDTGKSSNSVYYNIMVATASTPSTLSQGFFKWVISPLIGTPFLGNYLRPAFKVWPGDGSEKFGVFLSTTPNSSLAHLKTDATYYYRVQTIGATLTPSAWSSEYVAYTYVAPSSSTMLAAVTGTSTGTINLSWVAPGDDESSGTISSGFFRIFYSTSANDINALTVNSTLSPSLGRVDLATSTVLPGTTRYYTLSGLYKGATYYTRVFTGDEIPNWSNVSNGATMYAFGNEFYSTQGSGNWYSTVNNSPWEGGIVPPSTATVIIDIGDVIVATAPVTSSSITINSTGELDLDGTNQVVVLTILDGGKLVNNGVVKVLNDSNAVRIEGETGGRFTFEGRDVNLNGKKLYLGRTMYTPSLILSSGETLELSDSTTFYSFTTQSGSTFIQGADNDLYLTSHTVIAVGTFSKATGNGQVYISGNSNLNSNSENLGNVIIGHSPDRIILLSPLTVDSIRVNKLDLLITKGFSIKSKAKIENFGTIQNTE